MRPRPRPNHIAVVGWGVGTGRVPIIDQYVVCRKDLAVDIGRKSGLGVFDLARRSLRNGSSVLIDRCMRRWNDRADQRRSNLHAPAGIRSHREKWTTPCAA